MKLLPWYSRKNLLSPMRTWYTSLPEQRPYMRCHCSGDSWPSLGRAGGMSPQRAGSSLTLTPDPSLAEPQGWPEVSLGQF